MTSVSIPPSYWAALDAARCEAQRLRNEVAYLRNVYQSLGQDLRSAAAPTDASSAVPAAVGWRGTLVDIVS